MAANRPGIPETSVRRLATSEPFTRNTVLDFYGLAAQVGCRREFAVETIGAECHAPSGLEPVAARAVQRKLEGAAEIIFFRVVATCSPRCRY